jgi:hypothetical protein
MLMVAGFAMLSAGVFAPAFAGTPEEAKALCQKAAALIVAEGDKAFAKISDPSGEFLQGDMGVTVTDHHAVVLASYHTKLIGMDTWEITDPDGVKFGQEAVKLAETAGSGWIKFKSTNPATKKIAPKTAWVQKAGDFVVLATAPSPQ